MTSTRIQVKSIVLDRLSVLFDPKHAPLLSKGNPNPRYVAYVEIYLEALIPFDAWELEAGTKVALESHKYKHWPQPADMRNYCLQAARDAKQVNVSEKPLYLQDRQEERPGDPPEIKARMPYKMDVSEAWRKNGKMHAKNPAGTWRYTIQDMNREAEARQHEAEAKRRQEAQETGT